MLLGPFFDELLTAAQCQGLEKLAIRRRSQTLRGAAHAHEEFGAVVTGCEFLVTERPVVANATVQKVARAKAPGVRRPEERFPAYGGQQGIVNRLSRADDGVLDEEKADVVALPVRAPAAAKWQLERPRVGAELTGIDPVARLENDHAQPALGEFLGGDSARSPRAHDADIVLLASQPGEIARACGLRLLSHCRSPQRSPVIASFCPCGAGTTALFLCGLP